MKYKDLRDFIDILEKRGQLKRIKQEIDPSLEITEICDRTLRAGGPALLFENPKGSDMPVLGNLFGTPERVALGMGEESDPKLGAEQLLPRRPARHDDEPRERRRGHPGKAFLAGLHDDGGRNAERDRRQHLVRNAEQRRHTGRE